MAKIQIKGLEAATAALKAAGKAASSAEVQGILMDGAIAFRNEAYINAPIGTGATRRAIVAKPGQLRAGFVSAYTAVDFKLIPGGGKSRMQRYPYIVEFGSKPHQIAPKNGRMLRFMVGGRMRFARTARHPGIRAQYFFRDAISTKRRSVQRDIERRLKQLIESLKAAPINGL